MAVTNAVRKVLTDAQTPQVSLSSRMLSD